MTKTLYQIGYLDPPGEWGRCRLILEIGRHFSYSILDENNRIIRLTYLDMEENQGQGFYDSLQAVLDQDELLQHNYQEMEPSGSGILV
jgi:hypothetical protein